MEIIMKILPKGYYAVSIDTEQNEKGSFIYKGVEYSVTEGANLFASLADAAKCALEIPEEKLSGLESFEIDTPVILFSEGRHTIDRFAFNCDLTLLGQNAGINPNLPTSNRYETPEINPIRENNESVLYGSFWFGVYQVGNPDVKKIEIDGFSVKGARFNDLRHSGGKYTVSFKNMIHQIYDGHTLYNFASPRTDVPVERDVLYQNIRVVDFDDCDYGANFVNLCASKAIFDGFVHADTNQTFGICDSSRKKCNYSGLPTEYLFKNSLFKNNCGYGGFMTSLGTKKEADISLIFENTAFFNASQENCAPIVPEIGINCSLRLNSCSFADTRDNTGSAILVIGEAGNISIENCEFKGFSNEISEKITPTEAPDKILDQSCDFESNTEDSHTVIGSNSRDMNVLDKLYEGRQIYRGDLHIHTKCGGTSDGLQPMDEWTAKMDELGVDFAAVVDHRQMRGFFLPEWDDERFIIGTEPGAHLQELNACRHGMAEIHYNMLFPHKYGLAMVLANFPEFQFHGDELTGSFRYFHAPKSRYIELFDYVKSIGGIVVHAHPKSMLVSSDPLDYYYGEHTYIETIYDTVYSAATRNNYKLWCDLLAMGKHVYASGGSDSHSDTKNTALSAFYTTEKNGLAFFNQMHTGDFNIGSMGIKMCIGEHSMGSEIAYEEGMKLSIRICDYFDRHFKDNTVYTLRVFTDEGLAFESDFNGKEAQELQLEVKNRKFYRADVYDKTNECVVAISNPIWLDAEKT